MHRLLRARLAGIEVEEQVQVVRVSEAVARLPDVSHAFLDAPLKVHVVEAAEAGAGALPLDCLLIVAVCAALAEQGALGRPCPVLVGKISRQLSGRATLLVDHAGSLLAGAIAEASVVALACRFWHLASFLVVVRRHDVRLVGFAPEALEVLGVPQIDGDPDDVALADLRRRGLNRRHWLLQFFGWALLLHIVAVPRRVCLR